MLRVGSWSKGVLALLLIAAAVPAVAGLGDVSAPSLAGVQGPKHAMPLLGGSPLPIGSEPEPTVDQLIYHGGPITKYPKVFLTFWGWSLTGDPFNVAPYLQAFLAGQGGTAWAAVQNQYYDNERGFITNPSGQLHGVWFDDTLQYPPIPDLFVYNEAQLAAEHFGYDRDAEYVIAIPNNLGNAEFGLVYCAWHSSVTNQAGQEVAFTNLPYIPNAGGSCGMNSVNGGAAGQLDGVSIVEGHEHSEVITDPHLDAWYDANGAENADKCAWNGLRNINTATGTFAIQPNWSNAIAGCSTG